jgi:hypothetical protein
MTDDRDERARSARQMAELPAHLALAARSVPGTESQMPWIQQWIETALRAADVEAPSLGIQLGATLELSTGALVLEIAGWPDRIAPCIAQFMTDGSFAEDAPERGQLEQTVGAFGSDLHWLGYYTRVRGSKLSAGWFGSPKPYGSPMPVERALAAAPRTVTAAALGRWAEEHEASCTRFGGGIGASNPFTELVISPGGTPDRAFAAARALFDVLEVAPPPPTVIAEIEKRWGKTSGPELIVRLTATDLSRLGILMPGADLDYVPALPHLLPGTSYGLETVATFEGFLGVEHARWLEVGNLGGAQYLGLRFALG